MTATRNVKTLADLDRLLDRYADDHDGFTAKAKRRAQEWNRQGIELELRDPGSWREPLVMDPDARLASIEEQLRAEIETITIMDRGEEARHARRIEFARLRLEHALSRAGLEADDLDGRVTYDPTTYRDVCSDSCDLPEDLCRRWVELHHLRTELVERNLYLAIINVERYAHLGVGRLDLIQEGPPRLPRSTASTAPGSAVPHLRGALAQPGLPQLPLQQRPDGPRSGLPPEGDEARARSPGQAGPGRLRRRDRGGRRSRGTPRGECSRGVSLDPLDRLALQRRGRRLGRLAEVLGQADDSGVYSTEMEEVTLEDGIHDAMDRLSERERYVIEMRFGINREREHTLSEVARSSGQPRAVRQIQVRAISKMRRLVCARRSTRSCRRMGFAASARRSLRNT